MSQFNNKVVIVTGASQGIGASLVEAFATQGYGVVATSRNIKPSTTKNVVTVAGDVGDPKTAKRVVKTALEQFGRVDTLVNNAGIFIAKSLVDFTVDDFNKMVSTNLAGTFYMSQQAAIPMLKQGSGHILNISTSMVEQPMKSVPAALTALTKGGINAVTQALAIEYADRGIRVNAVAPGVVKTPMHAPETHAFLAGLHPMKRMGEISEIVEAVMYLEKASFVTGQILSVDGGAHAGQW